MILINYAKIKNLTLDKIANICLVCNTLNKMKISINFALTHNFDIPYGTTLTKAKNYFIEC